LACYDGKGQTFDIILTMYGNVTFVSREIGSPTHTIMDIIAAVVRFVRGFEMLTSVISLE